MALKVRSPKSATTFRLESVETNNKSINILLLFYSCILITLSWQSDKTVSSCNICIIVLNNNNQDSYTMYIFKDYIGFSTEYKLLPIIFVNKK